MSAATPAEDCAWMARALRLAERGLYSTAPNPRVGCVLVRNGELVGEGWHHHAGGPHAERVALAAAGLAARGATAYVTLEPCCHHGRTPPCTDALIAAGVTRVVFADADSNPRVDGGGVHALKSAGIAVEGGVLGASARELNRGFHRRHAQGRPCVTLKMGMSLDGRIALANGRSQWITGEAARADVQRLRARSCAIITGSGTVLADDPRLTVRDASLDLGPRLPARVVLDTRLRLPPAAQVLAAPGVCRVFHTLGEADSARALSARGAVVEALPGSGSGVDLPALLARLGALEYNEVLVEAGPGLAGAFINAGLVDELWLYVAPLLLGADARGVMPPSGFEQLAGLPRWQLIDSRAVGSDQRYRLRPASA